MVIHEVVTKFAAAVGQAVWNSAVAEFNRMRVDSRVAAFRNTMRLLNSSALFVCPSITRTPVTVRVPGSKIRLCTTLKGRTVSLPVFIAAGSVELRLLK